MAYIDATSNSGSSNAATVNVPSGVAAGDIVILCVQIDAAAGNLTLPAGFQMLNRNVVSAPDGGNSNVAFKRLTAADAGTYVCSNDNNQWAIAAIAFSGRSVIRPPECSRNNYTLTAVASPVSLPATSVDAEAGDDLLWFGCPDEVTGGGGTGFDPPGSFTEREDVLNGFANIAVATQENVSAGATGTITGTFNTTNTAAPGAFLVRLPAASGDVALPTSATPPVWLIQG